MSAKDDFELVRQACETLEAVLPAEKRADDAVEAFKRLFTPKPLRDVLRGGYENFWIKTDLNGYQKSYVHRFGKREAVFIYMNLGQQNIVLAEDYLDYLAIPILTPDDMGVK